MKMNRLWWMMSLCLLVACNDEEPADQLDGGLLDGGLLDGGLLDGGLLDGGLLDGGLLDGPVADGPATADGPVTDGASADLAPPALAAQIVNAYVWADLMPAVPPDPTHATISIELANSGSADVTGVTLTDSAIVVTASGTLHPLSMEPTQPFSGAIPAGQTLTVDFNHQPSNLPTPLPCQCGDKVKLRTSVTYDTGQIGPLSSGEITFDCTY